MAVTRKSKRAKEAEWSFVELTIGGKFLDPQRVEKIIKVPADSRAKRGDPVSPNSRRRCKAGFWTMESPLGNRRIETQMRNLLERILPFR